MPSVKAYLSASLMGNADVPFRSGNQVHIRVHHFCNLAYIIAADDIVQDLLVQEGNWSGKDIPRKREVYSRIVQAFQMDVNYWLSENEEFLPAAAQQYGSRGARQAQELLDEVNGLFAGGDLADEDMDEMMKAIQFAYWHAKEKNKKYTPKKYLKNRQLNIA